VSDADDAVSEYGEAEMREFRDITIITISDNSASSCYCSRCVRGSASDADDEGSADEEWAMRRHQDDSLTSTCSSQCSTCDRTYTTADLATSTPVSSYRFLIFNFVHKYK
jgi:hypothetical protein